MWKLPFLLFLVLISLNVFVVVQVRQDQTTAKTTEIITQPLYHLQKGLSTYGRYIEQITLNAKNELIIYKNKRPSTRCSLDDLVFTATRYLPDWVYPASVWKQDPITRHQKIIKVIKSPALHPYANDILNKAINWTSQTNQLLDGYIEETRLSLRPVYDITNDYMSILTTSENANATSFDMDTLHHVISEFLSTNQDQFDTIIKESNQNFDKIINLSGALRRPMESIRFDIIQSIKENKNKHLGHIEIALTQLKQHAKHELSESLSLDLKQYIIKPIREELASFYKTSTDLDHLKQNLSWLLSMSSYEFKHNPTQFSYWIDLLEEMRDVDIRLIRELPKKFSNKKRASACCANC